MALPIYTHNLDKIDTYPEAKVVEEFRAQCGVLAPDEVTGLDVGILEGFSLGECLDGQVQSLIRNEVGLLLGVFGVDKKGAARHDVHVAVLATDVHVYGLGC